MNFMDIKDVLEKKKCLKPVASASILKDQKKSKPSPKHTGKIIKIGAGVHEGENSKITVLTRKLVLLRRLLKC